MDDKKRLEVFDRYADPIYREAGKFGRQQANQALCNLHAAADVLGFEFNRHDSRSMKQIIEEDCPAKYRDKMLDRLRVLDAFQELDDELYEACL